MQRQQSYTMLSAGLMFIDMNICAIPQSFRNTPCFWSIKAFIDKDQYLGQDINLFFTANSVHLQNLARNSATITNEKMQSKKIWNRNIQKTTVTLTDLDASVLCNDAWHRGRISFIRVAGRGRTVNATVLLRAWACTASWWKKSELRLRTLVNRSELKAAMSVFWLGFILLNHK